MDSVSAVPATRPGSGQPVAGAKVAEVLSDVDMVEAPAISSGSALRKGEAEAKKSDKRKKTASSHQAKEKVTGAKKSQAQKGAAAQASGEWHKEPVGKAEVKQASAEVDSEAGPEGIESSVEKLRRSSEALRQFAQDMRTQYAFDQAMPETGTTDSGVDPTANPIPTYPVPSVSRETQASHSSTSLARVEDSPVEPLPGKSLLESAGKFFMQTLKQPEVFAHHYTNFAKEVVNIVQAKSSVEPERKDKRFRDAVWKDNIFYKSVMQTYLAWDREVHGWVNDLNLEDADRRRSEFLYEQVSALLSPANSPLNPVAVKRAYQTGGKSVVTGLKHMLEDLHTNHGMPSQIRSDAYTVGKDLAYSAGAVVHRTEVLELLQYQMDDGQTVDQRPVLIVPPQLNKFYVFDLTPKNSVVKYLQSQGIQPFVISWRNPSRHNAGWNLDRYVTELEQAIEVMCEITGSDQINLTSACAGGITSMALLGYLQAANKPLVHSHSLFVTALQADDSSSLGLFATREAVELSRKFARRQGYMDGKSLSHIFNWLRPTDLVWNFWINNYLLGKEPPSMDVLYWDNDSTRLPAGLHSDFLDIFIDDAFAQPGKLTVKGHAIDLRQLTMDFYCVGGDEDYLMPWKKCFEVPDLVSSDCTFVLSTSGHIQSILRPPGIANTAYYTSDQAPTEVESADQWLSAAQKNDGSWWGHWSQWLHQHSDYQRVASSKVGSDQHPPLSPAPGLYVNEKVS